MQFTTEETTNFFEWANQEVLGSNLLPTEKIEMSLALGFASKACETVGDLAIGAVQIINLEQEALLDLENKYVLHRETPQWIKDDLTGTRDNVQAVIGFAGDLIKRDPKAWKAVYKGIEDSTSNVFHNIATGNNFEIGGYVFDVATLVGPAAVGKLKYVDEASNLTKLADAGEVASTVGKVEDGLKVGQSTYEIIQQKLIEHNTTMANFNRLRATRVVDMTQAEYDMMVDIRNAIPHPTSQTVMQKIIPIEEADNYFGENAWGIRGYVTKRENVTNINNIKEAVEGLRLDYDGSKFVDANGNIITDGYVRIEFQTEDTGYIDIPFGKQNGIGLDPDPATGNGFTKSTKYSIPEYNINSNNREGIHLLEGAKMFLNIDGDEILVGISDNNGIFNYIGGIE